MKQTAVKFNNPDSLLATPLPPTAKHEDVVAITDRTNLPIFSARIQKALETNQIGSVWQALGRETALLQYTLNPMIGKADQRVYQKIGKKMYNKYPDIIREGVKPWAMLYFI